MDATNWADSTIEAIVATSIVQQLPNLMLSEFIKSARFTVTNQMENMFDHGRYGWVFGSSDYSSWENRTAVIFMSEHDEHTGLRRLENFKLRTESTLLDALFPDGEVGFSLSVDIDVFGGYSVVVSIDGAPEQIFTTPAYISPYVSPIITRDQTKLATIGTTLVGAINDVLR